jgi:hypothetical protein
MKSRMLEEKEVLMKIKEAKRELSRLKKSNGTEEEMVVAASEIVAMQLALSHLNQGGVIVIDDQGQFAWYNNLPVA